MGDEKWMKIPFFGKGTSSSLQRALTTGKFKDGLDKALFYFATDTKQWVLVDTDKTIHRINSYEGGTPSPGGEGNVVRVDQLPPILEAETDTLYIMDKTVYSFDGSAFYPTYQDCYDSMIGMLPEGMTVIDYVNDATAEMRQYTDEKEAEATHYTDHVVETKKNEAINEANQYTDERFQIHIVQGGG